MEPVRAGLEAKLPKQLVDELLAAYQLVKDHFYLGQLRPNEVEGGRFAEAVFRLLEFAAGASFTPLSKKLDTENIILRLQSLPNGKVSDSIRLHIPRALRVIYDVRNNRDAAHLADGIDSNLQDATLVVAICDWVLAELVRLYHSVPADAAQALVEGLVERKVLVVQDFGGFLKTLNPKWGPAQRILVTLYVRGKEGADLEELAAWLKPTQRANLNRTIRFLAHDKDLLHFDGSRCFITNRGLKMVEANKLLHPKD